MKTDQLISIHGWIRTARFSEIIFITALIAPGYLLMYQLSFSKLDEFFDKNSILIGGALYIIGIVWMKYSQSKREILITDLVTIKTFLLDKGFKYYSFERLQALNKKYSEDYIRRLIVTFPEELRLARLKDSKEGIKIITNEVE